MKKEVYRYTFAPGTRMDEVEEALLLAIFACESLHGAPRVRMDASYAADRTARTCIVDATTDVGQDICRIFTGFITREFGEDAFAVQRAGGTA
ncbi:MAG: hypothetical protein AAB215_06375 [Planctomycetota bacterium]